MARCDEDDPAAGLGGLGYLGDPPRSVRFSERRYRARQARKMLAEERAVLSDQVRRGLLTSQQRSRAMEVARAHARMTWGRGGDETRKKWVKRFYLWFFLPALGLALLMTGAEQIGPAYAAAHGHGALGYFTAIQADRCDSAGRCSWTGSFLAQESLHVRTDVSMDGTWPWSRVQPGTVIPALDSGDPSTVYPRTGSTLWEQDAWFLALGALVMLAWLWFMVVRRLLRRQGWRVLARRALNW